MTDANHEAESHVLRTRLDTELATVRATAQARERLTRAASARTRAENRNAPASRWSRPTLALPLAGATVAAVIAATVVGPTYLRSEDRVVPIGGAPVPAIPSTTPPATSPAASPAPRAATRPATAAPQPAPTASPGDSPIEQTPGAKKAADGLALIAKPSAPAVGEVFLLTVTGLPSSRGEMTVSWGDRQTELVPGRCAASRKSGTEMLRHRYTRAGRYRVQVTLNPCGREISAELLLAVTMPPTPAAG